MYIRLRGGNEVSWLCVCVRACVFTPRARIYEAGVHLYSRDSRYLRWILASLASPRGPQLWTVSRPGTYIFRRPPTRPRKDSGGTLPLLLYLLQSRGSFKPWDPSGHDARKGSPSVISLGSYGCFVTDNLYIYPLPPYRRSIWWAKRLPLSNFRG